jgi:hypothetical protein
MVRSEEIGVHWAPCFYIKRERVLLENLWKILRSQISVRSQGSHPRVMLSQSLPTSPCCQLWGIGKWWAPQTSMKKCSMCLSAHVEVKGQLLGTHSLLLWWVEPRWSGLHGRSFTLWAFSSSVGCIPKAISGISTNHITLMRFNLLESWVR